MHIKWKVLIFVLIFSQCLMAATPTDHTFFYTRDKLMLSHQPFLILLESLNGYGRISENGVPGGFFGYYLEIIRKITPC